ncbi:GntR family transcriptional regulator [Salmonella enterica subsp. enterica]|nr:GntR family transcriptional regulator [Salmonella enterica subsp. enterica serovar Newport]MIL09322.1 GntR family transcriptional regulator [Salmonella enterica subsp. enterica serovar Enteritidis]
MRMALICGQLTPEEPISLRSLAEMLGVSPMPIRAAVSRLVAEGALLLNKHRIAIPPMTEVRIRDLVGLRTYIETSLARRIAENRTTETLLAAREADKRVETSIASGDVEGYILANYAFHHCLHLAAAPSPLIPIMSAIWMQLGPFARSVYGRLGTAQLGDKHHDALHALESRDALALAQALRADAEDGGALLLSSQVETVRGDRLTGKARMKSKTLLTAEKA